MGCGASSLRGDDVPHINANAKPSYMRKLSTSYMPQPEGQTEHYETAQEHERDLQRVLSSQSQRRPSRPAYVDPNDLPMPPKTTHEHYHRRASENREEKPDLGYKERLGKARNAVMTPGEMRQQMRARGGRAGGSDGVVVPNGQRQRSFIG